MAKKDKDPKSLVNIQTDISPKTNVKVTDVAGLGALGKTPAGKEIARSVGGAIADSIRMASVAVLGKRVAEADAMRIVTIAEAEAKARQITAESRDATRIRAGNRLLADEMRRQDYIESATTKAIEYADTAAAKEAKPLDNSFVLSWIDGVKEAHYPEVRDIYSRILYHEAAGDGSVKGPSLALLKNLDSQLAKVFDNFAIQHTVYGCYPFMGQAKPAGKYALTEEDADYLQEIGFLTIESPDKYQLGNLAIGMPADTMFIHQSLNLTRRAKDIYRVIFDENRKAELLAEKQVSDSDRKRTIMSCFMECRKRTGSPVEISFNTGTNLIKLSVHYAGVQGSVAKYLNGIDMSLLSRAEMEALEDIFIDNSVVDIHVI